MNGKELAMPDRGHVFRRAFSWLPAQFASQSDAPVGAPRQFGSTEHLSVEAIAAFVDGELRMNAHLRAAHHLSQCAQCAAEVDDQSRRAPRCATRARSGSPPTCSGCWPRSPTSRPTPPTVWRTATPATGAGVRSVVPSRAFPAATGAPWILGWTRTTPVPRKSPGKGLSRALKSRIQKG